MRPFIVTSKKQEISRNKSNEKYIIPHTTLLREIKEDLNIGREEYTTFMNWKAEE